MVSMNNHCVLRKSLGLVYEVFWNIPAEWANANISRGISHVRYSTAGASTPVNAQPLMANMAGQLIGIAHNGTICNARSLRRELQDEGAIFQTTTDTELVLHMMARGLKRCKGDLWEALTEALHRLRGAYSLLLMTKDQMVAVRDPSGFRPLSIVDYNEGC